MINFNCDPTQLYSSACIQRMTTMIEGNRDEIYWNDID